KTKRITSIAAGLAGLIALLRHHKKKLKIKKEEPVQENQKQEQNNLQKFAKKHIMTILRVSLFYQTQHNAQKTFSNQYCITSQLSLSKHFCQ
ncbi:MAG: hypothetical protein HXJ92_01870, partial [candidate division SR1 bacterium]|nr:hypothetical protein [candidate division SR1 bacterium]